METATTTVNNKLIQISNALTAAKNSNLVASHYFDDTGFVCSCDTLVRAVDLGSDNVLTELDSLLKDIYAIIPAVQVDSSTNAALMLC